MVIINIEPKNKTKTLCNLLLTRKVLLDNHDPHKKDLMDEILTITNFIEQIQQY